MSVFKKMVCLFTLLTVAFSLSACDMPLKIVGSIPEPEETVRAFFDSVCKGDFKASDEYLSDMSLSMKNEIEGIFAQKLYHYLIESYDYKLNGQVKCSQLDAGCKVDFTCFDFNLISEDLKTLSTKLGKRYLAEGKEGDGYVEKKDGAIILTDEGAERIAAEALDELMKEPEKYYSTNTFDITMRYNGRKWLISIEDSLFFAISGGFNSQE